MTHFKVALVALAAASTVVTPALAEPAAPLDRGGEDADGSRRGAYEHDGLYLRFGLGFGGFTDALASDGENVAGDRSRGHVNGVASVGELMVGGALSPRWILGGGVWTSTVLASGFSQDEGDPLPVELEEPDNFTLVGPFVDWYFGPKPGHERVGAFHLQGAVALAVLNGFRPEQFQYDDDRRVAVGVGAMVGFGYEWWIGEQWGLGLLGRLTAAGLVENDSQDELWYHGVATLPAFLFTATYN